MPQILIISRHFPPGLGGSAVLMGNLFRQFPVGSCALVSAEVKPDLNSNIPAYRPANPPGILGRFLNHFEFMLAPLVYLEAARAAKQQHPRLIFSAYPSPAYLIAAYWLSKRANLPLYVYMHDMWQENMHRSYDRWVADYYEKRILRNAKKVYAITDLASKYFENKYGIKPEVLPHTVEFEGLESSTSNEPLVEPYILFTGAVYPAMNLDTIQSLVHALDGWDRKVKFLLVSLSDITWLNEVGIHGSTIEVRSAMERSKALELQRRAAILYLPLAFDTPTKLEIRTVFPTKATDYFLAGRPILLHAPGDCYTVENARKFNWAEVVDNKDPIAIRQAITHLLDNPQYARDLTVGALAAAHLRDARLISKQLQLSLLKE